MQNVYYYIYVNDIATFFKIINISNAKKIDNGENLQLDESNKLNQFIIRNIKDTENSYYLKNVGISLKNVHATFNGSKPISMNIEEIKNIWNNENKNNPKFLGIVEDYTEIVEDYTEIVEDYTEIQH
jgi:hypothetical protein